MKPIPEQERTAATMRRISDLSSKRRTIGAAMDSAAEKLGEALLCTKAAALIHHKKSRGAWSWPGITSTELSGDSLAIQTGPKPSDTFSEALSSGSGLFTERCSVDKLPKPIQIEIQNHLLAISELISDRAAELVSEAEEIQSAALRPK